jgi:hypothetical protein
MSIHKKVLRVTDEADKGTRAYAETNKIGVYDAATLLLLRGLNQGAESKPTEPPAVDALTVPEPTALRVRVYAESLCIDPGEAVGRLVEMAFLPREPDVLTPTVPGVTDYATSRGISYDDALTKLLSLGIRRQAALDTAAQKAKVST